MVGNGFDSQYNGEFKITEFELTGSSCTFNLILSCEENFMSDKRRRVPRLADLVCSLAISARFLRACIHRVSRGVACSRVFAEEIYVVQSFMRV